MSKQADAPLSSTERVRRYRDKIRKQGWTVVEVRVPAERVDDLRAYAKTLGKPKPKTNKNQMTLFDITTGTDDEKN
jgi:hypothetical protein